VRAVRLLIIAATLLVAAAPRADDAEPVTLRMAAISPEGTGWARELKALARDIEVGTHGAVHMKWYLGGIAGDELTALDRIRRGQLDGEAGALYCGSLSPTLQIVRLAGLVRNREEALYLIHHLHKRTDEEFRHAGFVPLAIGDFGNDIILLRNRVDTFAELRKTSIWMWNADDLLRKQFAAMGMRMMPGKIEELLPMYDAGRIDGMFVIPTAALAFQWTTRAHYFVDLRTSMLPGCVVVSQKAFDQLSFEQQQVVDAAAARFAIRFEELGKREDALLLDSLLEKQGVHPLAASATLRSAFIDAATQARERLDGKTLPREVLKEAVGILASYRTQNASAVAPGPVQPRTP
jgi:TRAP-type C4-dicarboxylate transport system substrate-binding protein